MSEKRKITMPKNEREFQLRLMYAFEVGVINGFGFKHEDYSNEMRRI